MLPLTGAPVSSSVTENAVALTSGANTSSLNLAVKTVLTGTLTAPSEGVTTTLAPGLGGGGGETTPTSNAWNARLPHKSGAVAMTKCLLVFRSSGDGVQYMLPRTPSMPAPGGPCIRSMPHVTNGMQADVICTR
jgi:hypothetical protein